MVVGKSLRSEEQKCSVVCISRYESQEMKLHEKPSLATLHMSKLRQIFRASAWPLLHRSVSGDAAISYLLPVLWMTSYVIIWRRQVMLKVTHRVGNSAGPRGRSRMSTIALLPRPWEGSEVLRWVCLSVCLSLRSHNSKNTLPNISQFYASCHMWPRLGSPVTALR